MREEHAACARARITSATFLTALIAVHGKKEGEEEEEGREEGGGERRGRGEREEKEEREEERRGGGEKRGKAWALCGRGWGRLCFMACIFFLLCLYMPVMPHVLPLFHYKWAGWAAGGRKESDGGGSIGGDQRCLLLHRLYHLFLTARAYASTACGLPLWAPVAGAVLAK